MNTLATIHRIKLKRKHQKRFSASDMLREILVVNHRQKSSELDLATKRVEFGSCVLSHLRESYAESRADCPCWMSPFEMDEMVKTAVNTYNGKKLTDDGAWLDEAPPSPSRGVMERVLESCRKQSEVARLLVHRETLYTGANIEELKNDLKYVEDELARCRVELITQESRLRMLSVGYEELREMTPITKYFRLKKLILKAIEED